jgi:hypothetical protein
MRFARALKLPNGQDIILSIALCSCDDRRGPAGGVCGNCRDAIPSDAEQERYNRSTGERSE